MFVHKSFAAGISRAVELESNCGDEKYLRLLKQNLPESLSHFSPDIILYNAGTDCLSGDPLGNLDVSREVSRGAEWGSLAPKVGVC